jgi:hypothetical protein
MPVTWLLELGDFKRGNTFQFSTVYVRLFLGYMSILQRERDREPTNQRANRDRFI